MCAKLADGLVFDDEMYPRWMISGPAGRTPFFEGGTHIDAAATALADDVVAYLDEIGSRNRRVAIE